MNKSELIDAIAEHAELSKAAAGRALDGALDAVKEGLQKGDMVTLVGFGTEAGLFQGAGIPTVVCGPGYIDQAHQADEFVSLQQLAACEDFLRALRRHMTS